MSSSQRMPLGMANISNSNIMLLPNGPAARTNGPARKSLASINPNHHRLHHSTAQPAMTNTSGRQESRRSLGPGMNEGGSSASMTHFPKSFSTNSNHHQNGNYNLSNNYNKNTAGSNPSRPSLSAAGHHQRGQGINPSRPSMSGQANRMANITINNESNHNHRQSMPPTNNSRQNSRSSNSTAINSAIPPSIDHHFGRRISLYGGVGDMKLKSDPRPIKDRAFIHASIQNIIQYLSANDYDKPLSPQMLTSPSSKDYFYLVEFLFRKIDPSFQFQKKPDEEIPALFKALRFPFQMSSRSLSSVGSPHTWPTFLAALQWLVELLRYDENAHYKRLESIQEDEMSQEALRESFLDYISQAYNAFMSNNDELDQELETRFVQSMLTRNEERRTSIESKRKNTQHCRQEIERLKNHEGRVHILRDRIAVLQRDLEKFEHLIRVLEENKAKLSQQLIEKTTMMNHERETVEILRNEIVNLETSLQHQLECDLDVTKINQERRELEKSIQIAVLHRGEIEKNIWSLEMEISKKFNHTEKNVCFFNQHMRTAGLMTKFSGEMRFDPQATPMLSLDLRKEVKPELKKYLNELRIQHGKNQELIFEMAHKSEQILEKVTLKRMHLSEYNGKLQHEVDELNRIKESIDEQRKQVELQISQLRTEAQALIRNHQESVSQREKAQLELVTLLEENRERYALEKKQIQDAMYRAIEWLASHKEQISRDLEQLTVDLMTRSSEAS